jgi:hypothetical protein
MRSLKLLPLAERKSSSQKRASVHATPPKLLSETTWLAGREAAGYLAAFHGDARVADDHLTEALRLWRGLWSEPATLNPDISTGGATPAIGELVLEGLTCGAPDGSYVPVLAAEVPTQANGDVSSENPTASRVTRVTRNA